jgi:uncharacterized membrane protein
MQVAAILTNVAILLVVATLWEKSGRNRPMLTIAAIFAAVSLLLHFFGG